VLTYFSITELLLPDEKLHSKRKAKSGVSLILPRMEF
jgi:hypothetical protein